jgi:hypothetical protein
MSKIGKYCKAYPITSFRDFQGWSENPNGFRTDDPATSPTDKFLYLQEDFTVTDGILLGEHVIFDAVTPKWVEYCKSTLQFNIPD